MYIDFSDIPMNISDKLLQLARRCPGVKVFDLGFSIGTNVHIQLCLLTFRVDHPSPWWQQERTEPQGVNLQETARLSAAAQAVRPAVIPAPRLTLTSW